MKNKAGAAIPGQPKGHIAERCIHGRLKEPENLS